MLDEAFERLKEVCLSCTSVVPGVKSRKNTAIYLSDSRYFRRKLETILWEGCVEEELILKIPMKTEDRAKTVFIKSDISGFYVVNGGKTKMVILTLTRVSEKNDF